MISDSVCLGQKHEQIIMSLQGIYLLRIASRGSPAGYDFIRQFLQKCVMMFCFIFFHGNDRKTCIPQPLPHFLFQPQRHITAYNLPGGAVLIYQNKVTVGVNPLRQSCYGLIS